MGKSITEPRAERQGVSEPRLQLGKNERAAYTSRPSRNCIARLTELVVYFFSSADGCGAAGGACAGGAAGVCEAPDIPSLKLRMPSPNPFMISGMRFPPKKIKMMARTTIQ